MPDAIAASGEDIVLALHAEGAQIYEWKADASGALGWVLREPTATLMDGKTVGRHYAGPDWEHQDGGHRRQSHRECACDLVGVFRG